MEKHRDKKPTAKKKKRRKTAEATPEKKGQKIKRGASHKRDMPAPVICYPTSKHKSIKAVAAGTREQEHASARVRTQAHARWRSPRISIHNNVVMGLMNVNKDCARRNKKKRNVHTHQSRENEFVADTKEEGYSHRLESSPTAPCITGAGT